MQPCCSSIHAVKGNLFYVENIQLDKNQVRSTYTCRIYLGNYRYLAGNRSHAGEVALLTLRNTTHVKKKRKNHVEILTCGIELLPQTAGSAIFSMHEIYNHGNPVYFRESHPKSCKLAVCRSDASLDLFSMKSVGLGSRAEKVASFSPNLDFHRAHEYGMCTSFDFAASFGGICEENIRSKFHGISRQHALDLCDNVSEMQRSKASQQERVHGAERYNFSDQHKIVENCESMLLLFSAYSSGKVIVYEAFDYSLKQQRIISVFTAHEMEIWCCKVHGSKNAVQSIIFSTGADDGLWKIWSFQKNDTDHLRLISVVKFPAGVVSICQVKEPCETSKQLCYAESCTSRFLVGCYDDIIRLYDLSNELHPVYLAQIPTRGGPWRIKQFSDVATEQNRSAFLVTCMYGGLQVITYEPQSLSELLRENSFDNGHQNFFDVSLKIQDLDNSDFDDLTYVAEVAPFPQPRDRPPLHKMVSITYYRSKLKLFNF